MKCLAEVVLIERERERELLLYSELYGVLRAGYREESVREAALTIRYQA